ncbi:MAG: hypothetical protein ACK5P5_00575 [Pseudobdellovibrionaceae bacterium]
MKYVFLLEDDPKFQKEISTALLETDAQLQIRIFDQLAEFAAWIKTAARDGPLSLAKAGRQLDPAVEELSSQEGDQLVLIVCKEEFLGSRWIGLIRKTRQWMIQKKISSEADPISLVITVFDNPSFDIKLVENRIINNVIFKPFDLLLLKQHLHFAVHGRHPPSELSVHNMKTTAQIEVIKDVHLERISELGMVTLSDRPIEINAVAKYYSDLFVSDTHKSVISICTACEKIEAKEPSYRCEFRFYGMDRNQLKKIRIKSVTASSKETVNLAKPPKKAEIASLPVKNVITIQPNSDQQQSLNQYFKNHFHQINLVQYGSLGQFLYALDPTQKKDVKDEAKNGDIPQLPSEISSLLIDLKNFDQLDWGNEEFVEDTFASLKESIQKKYPQLPTVYFTSDKPMSYRVERILARLFQGDLIYDLSDSMSLSKKIIYCQKDRLTSKELLEYQIFDEIKTIQVANPIRVTEISEAGLFVQYHRTMSIGSFRKFVLWTPHELGNPEFLASCNFVETKPMADGTFLNQFIFFGLTDGDLKHIRLWILENYVADKQAA